MFGIDAKKAGAAALAVLAAAAADAGAGMDKSVWISVPEAPVYRGPVANGTRAADGTSWFSRRFANAGEVKSAKWKVAGLGVFEAYVNGKRLDAHFLKPGFTHFAKTKYWFEYDVTAMLKRGKDEENVLAAEVSAGWWRDKIVTPGHNDFKRGFSGDKSAFRAELEIVYADGRSETVGTDAETWKCGVAGPVMHAAIFDGEEYDARVPAPTLGETLASKPEVNTEFKGELLQSPGAEVYLRRDLAMARGPYTVKKGETLVVDFGQNCSGVPEFKFRAARGTVLLFLPGEMLNDADRGSRGSDGPKGSVYRENLRIPNAGMRVLYTFAGTGVETYMPRFTFFGYRYAAISATDDVEIESVATVPVTSISKEMETGRIETGDMRVNKLISNVYWGQLSNYLSVPTDCPQRNERLGWTADTQVFCEAGAFNADTSMFFRKWMRDMRDSQDPRGGFPGVAPYAQYGDGFMRLGWADAGVMVPYRVWLHFGDTAIVDGSWDAMEKFMARAAETKYRTENLPEASNYQWNDWLSLTRLESAPYKPEYSAFEKRGGRRAPKPDALRYWAYMGGCHWLWDSMMMAKMAAATGRADGAAKYAKMEADARAYMKAEFFSEPGGGLPRFLDGMQTPILFALKLGLLEGKAKASAIEDLKASFAKSGGTFHTGFLGTSIILDTLSENGMDALAYDLLLNRSFPGWLYSVDQGATTIWERWNSYTKDTGFGPVGMNSFNHYAYGSVLAWIYKTAAGIAPAADAPGFATVVMRPAPDRRLGRVEAELKTKRGVVKSAWRYEGAKWIWEFEIPPGANARVTAPGDATFAEYGPGTHRVERVLD